jgi:hypothetical protein
MTPRPSVIPSIVAAVIANPTDECVIPPNQSNGFGYVHFALNGRANILAHRYAYEQAHGPIPEGYQVDHLCHDIRVCQLLTACPHRGCINPAHLAAVTARENTLRSNAVSARAASVTHCPQGHPYDETNTYPRPDGGRGCRICRRDTAARYETTRTRDRRKAS